MNTENTDQEYEFCTARPDYESTMWDPLTRKELSGKVAEHPYEGQFNKYFLTIEDENSNKIITPQHADLSNQIKKLSITKGEHVQIIYEGIKQLDEDRSVYVYELGVWRPKKKER